MGFLLAVLALSAVPCRPGEPASPQETAEASEVERVTMADRTELRGEIVDCDPSGSLGFLDRESGRRSRLVAEEVRKIRFGKDEAVQPDPKGERVHLVRGGTLSGRVRSCEGGVVSVETPAGTFRVPRGEVRSLSLSPIQGAFPEIKDERKDVLLREVAPAEGKPECSAVYGELRALTEKEVVFRGAKGTEEVFDRTSARKIYLHQDRAAQGELAPGWFAKVVFRNGDRLAGILRSVGKGRVRIFSHFVGDAEIEKRHLHSITFVRYPRLTVDNILVCDQNGVREFDPQGREVWSYGGNVQVAGSARRTEGGNVLIAATNQGQVIEVEPTGRSGGKIVWQLNNLNYPSDAVRLENGNTLVVEQQANRVVEVDSRTKESVWTCVSKPYPTSVQRLENGNTLISSFQGLEEVDREGRVRWTLGLGRIRSWKAQRLENGNTLIADLQRNQVVEIDPQSKEVWKMEGLQRPFQAIRLEDGNTLILEQGTGRVIEVDPSKRSTDRITGLNMPQAFSTY